MGACFSSDPNYLIKSTELKEDLWQSVEGDENEPENELPLPQRVSYRFVSGELAKFPLRDPLPPTFYDIKNPVHGTDAEKISQLQQMSDSSAEALRFFFRAVAKDYRFTIVNSGDEVTDKCNIYLKWNRKTAESIAAKAHRPSILQEYPEYGIEHIRDSFRFKAVVFDLETAFLFLFLVASSEHWTVVKLDIDKLIEPKEWGWRFIGCDIQLKESGHLVECYIVFGDMENAKKRASRPDLTAVSNHDIFERWRGSHEGAVSKEEQLDREISNQIYDAAFFHTMRRTNFVAWKFMFASFSFKARANSFYESFSHRMLIESGAVRESDLVENEAGLASRASEMGCVQVIGVPGHQDTQMVLHLLEMHEIKWVAHPLFGSDAKVLVRDERFWQMSPDGVLPIIIFTDPNASTHTAAGTLQCCCIIDSRGNGPRILGHPNAIAHLQLVDRLDTAGLLVTFANQKADGVMEIWRMFKLGNFRASHMLSRQEAGTKPRQAQLQLAFRTLTHEITSLLEGSEAFLHGSEGEGPGMADLLLFWMTALKHGRWGMKISPEMLLHYNRMQEHAGHADIIRRIWPATWTAQDAAGEVNPSNKLHSAALAAARAKRASMLAALANTTL
jgi:hypothetical protein